ncbi:TonB-dependent receptor [Colwellia sp. 1_MG-2023]|uniref:TonB-dependent receptor plug domain-containing protein n=1 Tax=Colwellia sp. 1_MG-2023 TaxID=3062649 RepID=UPI0026E43712|nr:TonB-dependent receptor [Colwellia sp. 1_MG-2023]MDO6446958.1 TonB-dependent receptor [Colwellia sp. 1_MG-2023]
MNSTIYQRKSVRISRTSPKFIGFIMVLATPTLYANNNIEKVAQTTEVITVTGKHVIVRTKQGQLAKVHINAKQIAAIAANNISDALRGIAGIDVFEQGNLTYLSVRGGDPNFVTILIDGVKVNDPTNSRGGAFDLSTIDPSLIASIEVFYGSYSTVFGSDSLSGVISIKTKSFTDAKNSISFKTGSNNAYGGAIQLATPVTDYAQLSLSGSFQDGDNSHFGEKFNRQSYIGTIKSTQSSNTNWRLGAFYSDGKSANFPEDSGGDKLTIIKTPEERDFQQTNVTANIQQHINNNLTFAINSAWSEREENITSPGIASGVIDGVPAIDTKTDYNRVDISSTANYLANHDTTIALGFAYASEDGGMDSVIDFGMPVPADYTLTRTINSVFAEAAYKAFDNFNLMLGIRQDKANNENSAQTLTVNTHRMIANYQISSATKLTMQYSEGFKLPSFFAVGHPFVGNAALKPELSENYEMSLTHYLFAHSLTTNTSLYKTTYKNLIDFDPIAFININRAKVQAKGVEFSFNYQLNERFDLAGNLTYNKMNTFDEAVKLRRRPLFKSALSMNIKVNESLSINARAVFNDNYYDSSIPTGMIDVEAFNRLDLSAVWSFNNDLTLRANANNVLNNSYEEAVGFSNVGADYTVSIAKAF